MRKNPNIAAGFVICALLICASTTFADELLVKTYDVSKLADDRDTLIEAITCCVQPTSWDEVGGKASIAAFEATGRIVVRQTDAAHGQISAVFVALEKLRQVNASTMPGKPHPPQVVRRADRRGRDQLVVYDVLDLVRKEESDDYDWLIEHLDNIAPETWDVVGGRGTMAVIPMRGAMIINQTEDVQRLIREEFTRLRKQ